MSTEPDLEPSPPPSWPDPAPKRPQPAWSFVLTPIAVVIGSIIIAGAIWYTDDDPEAAAPSVAAAISTAPPAAPDTAPPVSTVQDIRTALVGYAKQTGVDEAKFQQCLGDQANVAVINAQFQRGAALGINGTPTFLINNKKLVGAQPAAIFDEIVSAELKGSPASLEGYSPAVQALAAAQPPLFEIMPSKPDVSDAAIEGSANARVMIAEFSDFQCPFCKRWSDENMKRLRTQTGNDVAIAFLHFPIGQIHPNAGNASLAAVCAGEQGKFWQMHDILFARQSEWANLRAN